MKQNQTILKALTEYIYVRLKPKELENSFRADSFTHDKTLMKILLILVLILAIAFVERDISSFQEFNILAFFIPSQIAAIIATLIALWFLKFQLSPQKVDWIMFVWGLIILSHMLGINQTNLTDYLPVILWDIVALFWIYFLIPLPFHFKIALALFLSISSITIWCIYRMPFVDLYENMTILVAYLITNVIGIFRSRLDAQIRRENYVLINMDALTGISNRRYLLDQFARELERTKRYGYPLSIMLIDLDNLKKVNDQYGHAAGDEYLVSFAKRCASQIRSTDYFARFGGDEFIVLLVQTDRDQAKIVAERIRKSIEGMELKRVKDKALTSISIGLTTTTKEADSPDELIKLADKALYQAKNGGRNQIRVV